LKYNLTYVPRKHKWKRLYLGVVENDKNKKCSIIILKELPV